MTTNTNMEIWYMMSGESETLPAGTYQYRAYVGDYGHFDDAFLCVTAASAVCENRIPSASFETPVQSMVNEATSVGTSTNGWYSKNGSNINITKVDGSDYPLGPDVAYQGVQYVSLSGMNDYLVRDFTLTCASTLNFSGYFANRPNDTYSDWTGRIDILDASNEIVANSTTQAFTSATSQETWYLLYGSSSSLPPGNYKYQISLGREGNFDQGYLCVATPSCAVLPLVWKSFTATKEQNTVVLNWTTAQEQNSLNFIIQHSANGSNWNDIGRVNAAGNSISEKKYSFKDINFINGNNYYRIQQYNADGKPSLSEVKIMKLNSISSAFSINSNMVTSGKLMVTLNSEQTLRLYSSDGNLLLQTKYKAGIQLLDISRYGKGIYLLSNGQKTEKFVIQK